ncbi:uncharacterized protein LOC131245262 isoform X2 [Magnolia sinica]|uniref:uncharacterized protein LOC131245262 isoform X2 n=1 Tax=Magnolia sinica TaxID=86752 RepID=UPI00265A8A5A|nr:uncharacterized protein LOC131245262 isoform X2 [Magnolia sinica]
MHESRTRSPFQSPTSVVSCTRASGAAPLTNPSAKEMGFHVFALCILSLWFRPLHPIKGSAETIRRTTAFLISVPILSSTVLALSDHQSFCRDPTDNVICQLEEMKQKVSRLESILEVNMKSLNAKDVYLEEKEKLIEEMTHKIHFLQNAMVDIKKSLGDSSYYEERVRLLEDEVRLLWAESRKNNFNIHVLDANARDAEEKLEELTSQVEKMGSIVTEQWIQIQQLEQALQITEIRKTESTRCIFLKLQGTVKQVMERNEFTAAFVNKEVVFFMASALITFPAMGAWIFYSSYLS